MQKLLHVNLISSDLVKLSSKSFFFVDSLGFSKRTIMSSLNRGHLISSFINLDLSNQGLCGVYFSAAAEIEQRELVKHPGTPLQEES